MKILKYKPPKPEEGFSLIEVLVTALVLVGFLLGGLQAITLATLLRVQAQRKTEAVNWINNDKTKIEYEAFDIPDTDPVDDRCDLEELRDRLGKTSDPDYLGYEGDVTNTALNNTTSSVAHEIGIFLVNPNKTTYRVARFYRLIPNATNPTTLQITWHLWDEGNTVVDNDTGGNPDLGGTGGDADDRSIAILTTEVVPNIANCN